MYISLKSSTIEFHYMSAVLRKNAVQNIVDTSIKQISGQSTTVVKAVYV